MTDNSFSDSQLDKLENDIDGLVAEFRVAAQAQQLVISEECDDFIKRCLRVKDFNMDKALELSKQFRIASMEIRKWGAPFSPSLHHHQGIFNKLVFLLSQRDLGGRRIVLVNLGDWDPNENPCEQYLTAILLVLQFATTEYLESQRNGVVMIINCNSFSAYQAWSIQIKRTISFLSWMQKGVLGRMKAVHFIYHPRLVIDVLYRAVKPFLSAKMQQRFLFHGDVSSLHKFIDPTVLPPNFRAGSDRNVTYDVDDFRDNEFHERLLEQDQLFQTWMEKGFPTK